MQPSNSSAMSPEYGALVISLDFELHWGVRDTMPVDGSYRGNLLGGRKAVPRILDLFEEFGIGATWATVGFLFARNRRELEEFSPAIRPDYRNKSLDGYREAIGADESDDPLHYAASLIDEIRRRPRQELATHTFSHYYCREDGSTENSFREDLKSAVRITALHGVTLRSLVFPRNQYTPESAAILKEAGITSYRSAERHWMYQGSGVRQQRTMWRRGARLLDNYISLSGPNVTDWGHIRQANGLCNIPSSRFLRPYSKALAAFEPLRLRRICRALEHAARNRSIFHLNWHPHNFGRNLEENLRVLRSILNTYARLGDRFGMRSLSMQDVAQALGASPIAARMHAGSGT